MSERIFTGFLFLIFLILFSGNRQIPGLATGAVGHSLFLFLAGFLSALCFLYVCIFFQLALEFKEGPGKHSLGGKIRMYGTLAAFLTLMRES